MTLEDLVNIAITIKYVDKGETLLRCITEDGKPFEIIATTEGFLAVRDLWNT